MTLQHCNIEECKREKREKRNPVDTRRRFNVYRRLYDVATSYRRLIDIEKTSCVYWEKTLHNHWHVTHIT